MSRYRFALRPRWIASHVLVLVLVVVMINLGFWQLRRLDDKKSYNRSVRANESQPVAPLDAVMSTTDPSSRGKEIAFRRVSVTGTWDVANEVLVRARSLHERPGVWVVTPLRTAAGTGVIVVRGFLPTQGTPEAVPADAEPPTGVVTVVGLVQETQTKGTFGATDPSEGRLRDLARVDVARLQQQIDYSLYPTYVQLTSTQPSQPSGRPEVLPEPALDEGPHLGYAIQWFIFSTIAIVGYPLILRRSARNREQDDALETDDVDQHATATPTLSAR